MTISALVARLSCLLIVAGLLAQLFAPLAALAAVANRALLLTAGRSEPSYEVMRQQLVRLNVPYTTVDVITTDLTADLLQTGSDGNFSMIILSTGNLAYERDAGVWESALSAAEWDRLWNYARTHAVRTIAYYTFPTAEYGLSWTGEVTTNTTGRLTTAGRRIFADVQPSAAIPIRSYTYLSTPLPGFTPWVIDPSGRPLIGLWQPGDGREILVSTTDQGVYEIASALLTPSMLRWVSKGAYRTWRVYFTMHIDDFFIGNEHWPTYDHELRMTAADLQALIDWQRSRGLKLDLVFNGEGYTPGDPLSDLALQQSGEFRWINHTYTHSNLDQATYEEALREFRQNIRFANSHDLFPFDRNAAVTGDHSGIKNPNVLAAARSLNIRYLATDASREPNPYVTSNGILMIPRHPSNIFTDVATRAEEVARYNGIYGTNLTYEEIIDRESDIVVRHMLSGDPRPHFAHQINLTGDRILYDLMDAALAKFRSLSTKPISQPRFQHIGQLLIPLATPSP